MRVRNLMTNLEAMEMLRSMGTVGSKIPLPPLPGHSCVRLTLPYPPLNNRYFRHVGAKVLLSSEARRYKATVAALAPPLLVCHGPMRVAIDAYRPRRAGDLDSIFKGILDALQGVAYVNDSQIVELRARRFDDKENPRVEVTIEEVMPNTTDTSC